MCTVTLELTALFHMPHSFFCVSRMVVLEAIMDLLRVVVGTMLAAGWFLLSILSPIGRLFPRLRSVQAPPPRLSGPRADDVRSDYSTVSPSHERPTSPSLPCGSEISAQQTTSSHVHFVGGHAVQSVQAPGASPTAMSPPLVCSLSPARGATIPASFPILEIDSSKIDAPVQAGSSSRPPLTPANASQPPRHDSSDACANRLSSGSSDTMVASQVSSELQDDFESHRQPRKKHKLLRMTSVPLGDTKKHRNSCILRKHKSLSSGPQPRTDPYQAPYFFPTPASPEAADYVHHVRQGRISSISPPPDRGVHERQYDHKSGARRSLDALKFSPSCSLLGFGKDTAHEDHQDEGSVRKRHWHLLPRSRHGSSASLDADARTRGLKAVSL